MIWIDSNFAVDWLLGKSATKELLEKKSSIAILPDQLAETLVYFRKLDPEFSPTPLESIPLRNPEFEEVNLASRLYLQAKRQDAKISFSDAILAAVSTTRNDPVFSFDRSLESLGLLRDREGVWLPPSYAKGA